MGLIYIKIKTDEIITDSGQLTGQNRLVQTFKDSLTKVLTTIIPKANPDFDDKIRDVRHWILEVDDEEGRPEREIGLDDQGNVMMIMPWQKNYGFWTDSNVLVDDLAKSHEMDFVDKDYFERLWTTFDTKNGTR